MPGTVSKKQIEINPRLRDKFPALRLGILQSSVVVSETPQSLKEEMERVIRELSKQMDAEYIRQMPAVKSCKDAYRLLGKDPNRYRPSAESLLRRVSSGKGLYSINAVVDCLNLTSLRTGFSICGYDIDKIDGAIRLGIANEDEPYQGIGRGQLNISNLPVFRDAQGAFGTPTSDSMRTLIDESTTEILLLIPDFDGQDTLEKALQMMSSLLIRFVKGADPRHCIL